MKLSAINEWLTFTANIGVLAGIIFLAIEIQQNWPKPEQGFVSH
jgi:hypothetical protein